MKIKAISKTNCFKCKWAKEKLAGAPIEWVLGDEVEELAKKYNLNAIPTFLIFQEGKDVIITQSVLAVQKYL